MFILNVLQCKTARKLSNAIASLMDLFQSWIYALSSYLAKELEEPAEYREFTRIVTVSKVHDSV